MKQGKSILTRCFALVLALVLFASTANLGTALKAFAAGETDVTVTAGQLVIQNIAGLSDAEKELILSGNLVDEEFVYTPLSEGGELVVVDNEKKTIKAEGFKGWTPIDAGIYVGEELKEEVALVDGVGSYSYDQNAFSVRVTYSLETTEISVETQDVLLNAGYYLEEGVAAMDVAKQVSLLEIVEGESFLELMVEGVMMYGQRFGFTGDSLTAAQWFLSDLTDDGKLALQVHNENYMASASKTQYLAEHGADYEKVVNDTYANLVALSKDEILTNTILGAYLDSVDPVNGSLFKTFKGLLNNSVNALAPAAFEWGFLDAQYLAAEPNYAQLDAMIKDNDFTEVRSGSVNLFVDFETIQVNMSMKNVQVKVIWKGIEEKDSNELAILGEHSGTITLADNSTAEQIAAEAQSIIDEALEAFEGLDENWVVSYSELPDALVEDIEYVITYEPKELAITYGEGFEADEKAPASVYYGYTMTLPGHENAQKAYDYTVNGEAYIQGDEIVIVEDIEISRVEGKKYTYRNLYTEIAKQYGNETAYAILSSGALLENETLHFRMPEGTNITFEANTLTVGDYEGWVAYTYGDGADVVNYFAEGEKTATYGEDQAVVTYKLDLGYDNIKTANVLNLAYTLQTDANGQISALNRLYGYTGSMAELTGAMLGVLKTFISTSDFQGADGDNDPYTVAMREHFISVLTDIETYCMDDAGQYLALYTDLYIETPEGVVYTTEQMNQLRMMNYYQNSDVILEELSLLSYYLDLLLCDDENSTSLQKQDALRKLCNTFGKPEYAEKIANLQSGMASVKADLKAPHSLIDVESDNLFNLVTILLKGGKIDEVKPEDCGRPFVQSEGLKVVDKSQTYIEVRINIDDQDPIIFWSTPIGRGDVMPDAEINNLISKANGAIANGVGDNAPYYNFVVDGSLEALKGVNLDEVAYVTYTYTAKEYTVKVEGMKDQTVSVLKPSFNLAKPQNAAVSYKYTVGEKVFEPGVVVLNPADFDTLFVNGVCSVERAVFNEAESTMDNLLTNLNKNTSGNVYTAVQDENGNTVKLVANVNCSQNGLMDFVFDFVINGYKYIGLNGQPLVATNEEGYTEISMQTLINAMLADDGFGSARLIDLGYNNGGLLLTASMQLGKTSNPEDWYYEDVVFELHLNGVPAQMLTVAQGLNAVKNNMYFESRGDHLFVYLDLPEKVYEVYLTGKLAEGSLDRGDINAINNEIAFQFLNDYIDLIVNTDISAYTFENTLEIFDAAANKVLDKDIPDYDIGAYDKYLQLVKKALSGDGIQIVGAEESLTIGIKGEGKHIMTLINTIGLDLGTYNDVLEMVKEFKPGNTLEIKVIGTLANTAVDYEAVVFDLAQGVEGVKDLKDVNDKNDVVDTGISYLKGENLANTIDYTSDLPTRVSEIKGKSIIVLLDDVHGDLYFADSAIIDLNGMTIHGNIVTKGHVYIMDSTLDTYNAGGVTGTISGTATIVAGNYDSNVSACLPDGYLQDGKTVRNALYFIESPENRDLIVTINTDVMYDESVSGYLPSVRALAVDLAADLATNYYLSAMLAVDGNTIVNIDFDDLVGKIASDTPIADSINEVLCMFDAEGTSNFINLVVEDLLDFAALQRSISNGTMIASYDLSIAPYGVEIEHITDGDYLTINLGSVESHGDTFKVGLKMEGNNKSKIAYVYGELASIVVAENTHAIVDLEQPYYADRTLWLAGSAKSYIDVDLTSNTDYQTVIAVVLAYGNPDKAEALINAIGDDDELKAIFNTMTVEEVFTALKAMELGVSFVDMANALGVKIDITEAARIEKIYHVVCVGAGYILDRLDITGFTDKTMGMLEVDDSGCYVLSYSPDVYADITRRGYTIDAEAVVEYATLSVKIFGETCLWGDANHDGKVNGDDATLILLYELGIAPADFCTKRTDVNGDGAINGDDATMVLWYELGAITEFPAEKK